MSSRTDIDGGAPVEATTEPAGSVSGSDVEREEPWIKAMNPMRRRLREAVLNDPTNELAQLVYVDWLVAHDEYVAARFAALKPPILLEWICPTPEGGFRMGATSKDESDPNYDPQAWDDEGPPHQVEIEEGFWMATVPVTNAQYQASDAPRSEYADSDRFNRPNQPVVGVSWHDARAYCAWLQKQLGDEIGVTVDLPTEEQWEWAARGTDSRRFPWGNEEPTPEHAAFNRNTDGPPDVSGYEKGEGPHGCRHQAGTVWVWCKDEWTEDYSAKVAALEKARADKAAVEAAEAGNAESPLGPKVPHSEQGTQGDDGPEQLLGDLAFVGTEPQTSDSGQGSEPPPAGSDQGSNHGQRGGNAAPFSPAALSSPSGGSGARVASGARPATEPRTTSSFESLPGGGRHPFSPTPRAAATDRGTSLGAHGSVVSDAPVGSGAVHTGVEARSQGSGSRLGRPDGSSPDSSGALAAPGADIDMYAFVSVPANHVEGGRNRPFGSGEAGMTASEGPSEEAFTSPATIGSGGATEPPALGENAPPASKASGQSSATSQAAGASSSHPFVAESSGASSTSHRGTTETQDHEGPGHGGEGIPLASASRSTGGEEPELHPLEAARAGCGPPMLEKEEGSSAPLSDQRGAAAEPGSTGQAISPPASGGSSPRTSEMRAKVSASASSSDRGPDWAPFDPSSGGASLSGSSRSSGPLTDEDTGGTSDPIDRDTGDSASASLSQGGEDPLDVEGSPGSRLGGPLGAASAQSPDVVVPTETRSTPRIETMPAASGFAVGGEDDVLRPQGEGHSPPFARRGEAPGAAWSNVCTAPPGNYVEPDPAYPDASASESALSDPGREGPFSAPGSASDPPPRLLGHVPSDAPDDPTGSGGGTDGSVGSSLNSRSASRQIEGQPPGPFGSEVLPDTAVSPRTAEAHTSEAPPLSEAPPEAGGLGGETTSSDSASESGGDPPFTPQPTGAQCETLGSGVQSAGGVVPDVDSSASSGSGSVSTEEANNAPFAHGGVHRGEVTADTAEGLSAARWAAEPGSTSSASASPSREASEPDPFVAASVGVAGATTERPALSAEPETGTGLGGLRPWSPASGSVWSRGSEDPAPLSEAKLGTASLNGASDVPTAGDTMGSRLEADSQGFESAQEKEVSKRSSNPSGEPPFFSSEARVDSTPEPASASGPPALPELASSTITEGPGHATRASGSVSGAGGRDPFVAASAEHPGTSPTCQGSGTSAPPPGSSSKVERATRGPASDPAFNSRREDEERRPIPFASSPTTASSPSGGGAPGTSAERCSPPTDGTDSPPAPVREGSASGSASTLGEPRPFMRRHSGVSPGSAALGTPAERSGMAEEAGSDSSTWGSASPLPEEEGAGPFEPAEASPGSASSPTSVHAVLSDPTSNSPSSTSVPAAASSFRGGEPPLEATLGSTVAADAVLPTTFGLGARSSQRTATEMKTPASESVSEERDRPFGDEVKGDAHGGGTGTGCPVAPSRHPGGSPRGSSQGGTFNPSGSASPQEHPNGGDDPLEAGSSEVVLGPTGGQRKVSEAQCETGTRLHSAALSQPTDSESSSASTERLGERPFESSGGLTGSRLSEKTPGAPSAVETPGPGGAALASASHSVSNPEIILPDGRVLGVDDFVRQMTSEHQDQDIGDGPFFSRGGGAKLRPPSKKQHPGPSGSKGGSGSGTHRLSSSWIGHHSDSSAGGSDDQGRGNPQSQRHFGAAGEAPARSPASTSAPDPPSGSTRELGQEALTSQSGSSSLGNEGASGAADPFSHLRGEEAACTPTYPAAYPAASRSPVSGSPETPGCDLSLGDSGFVSPALMGSPVSLSACPPTEDEECAEAGPQDVVHFEWTPPRDALEESDPPVHGALTTGQEPTSPASPSSESLRRTLPFGFPRGEEARSEIPTPSAAPAGAPGATVGYRTASALDDQSPSPTRGSPSTQGSALSSGAPHRPGGVCTGQGPFCLSVESAGGLPLTPVVVSTARCGSAGDLGPRPSGGPPAASGSSLGGDDPLGRSGGATGSQRVPTEERGPQWEPPSETLASQTQTTASSWVSESGPAWDLEGDGLPFGGAGGGEDRPSGSSDALSETRMSTGEATPSLVSESESPQQVGGGEPPFIGGLCGGEGQEGHLSTPTTSTTSTKSPAEAPHETTMPQTNEQPTTTSPSASESLSKGGEPPFGGVASEEAPNDSEADGTGCPEEAIVHPGTTTTPKPAQPQPSSLVGSGSSCTQEVEGGEPPFALGECSEGLRGSGGSSTALTGLAKGTEYSSSPAPPKDQSGSDFRFTLDARGTESTNKGVPSFLIQAPAMRGGGWGVIGVLPRAVSRTLDRAEFQSVASSLRITIHPYGVRTRK